MKILVDESVLIPRPETEEMVYRITGQMNAPFDWGDEKDGWAGYGYEAQNRNPDRIIDLGTGSGCIALALKAHFTHADVTGLEADQAAMKMARRNGAINQPEVHWVLGNMQEADSKDWNGPFDLIVSNPPYVLLSERAGMASHVVGFEPEKALYVSDQDPLLHYRSIARFCRKHLADKGAVWVEINERFGMEVARLFRDTGLQGAAIFKDIYGKERFIRAGR